MRLLRVVMILWLAGVQLVLQAADKNSGSAWEKVSDFFKVPAKFKDQYGDFRSPLLFYDGTPVTTPAEWQQRRQEILERWHERMGKWPALLEDQELAIISSERVENHTRHKVEFNWIPGEKTDGYLLVPDGKGVKPAVIVVYYEPETPVGIKEFEHRDFARQLVRRGFVALAIGTRETSARNEFALYYPSIDNATVQPLSMLACAAANAWHVLAKVKGVDPERIGITGQSFGGKWSMFASCLFDKFACGAWSDGGIVFGEDSTSVNYWEPWYLGYHPKPWRKRGLITGDNPAFGVYGQLRRENMDLTELHALMAPRPFLVSGGSEDPPQRWVALNHAIKVNQLLGAEHRVAMTNRPKHAPNEQSVQQLCDFFAWALKLDKEE